MKNAETKPAASFFEYVRSKLQDLKTQMPAIREAGNAIAATRKNGGTFYIFGSGHSHILAEELYARAGGLSFVKPILPTELMVLEFPTKSTFIERLEGYSAGLIDQYSVQSGDVMIIASNSGRNAVPVEMAMEAKKRGCTVIAVTSLEHSRNCTSRHSSGRRLFELADIVIDNLAPAGDADFPIEGSEAKMGPVSDILGCSIMQAIAIETAQALARMNEPVEIFVSSNADGGDEKNAALFEKSYAFKR